MALTFIINCNPLNPQVNQVTCFRILFPFQFYDQCVLMPWSNDSPKVFNKELAQRQSLFHYFPFTIHFIIALRLSSMMDMGPRTVQMLLNPTKLPKLIKISLNNIRKMSATKRVQVKRIIVFLFESSLLTYFALAMGYFCTDVVRFWCQMAGSISVCKATEFVFDRPAQTHLSPIKYEFNSFHLSFKINLPALLNQMIVEIS